MVVPVIGDFNTQEEKLIIAGIVLAVLAVSLLRR